MVASRLCRLIVPYVFLIRSEFALSATHCGSN